MGTAGHGFPVVWREDAGFASGWAALPWNSRAAQSSPGAPGIALSQQSRGELRYSGHCCSAGISLGSGIAPGIWPLLPAMSLCPARRRALGHPGGVPESVPSSLPFSRPASSLAQTGPAGSAVPAPLSRLGSGPGTQPVGGRSSQLLNPTAAFPRGKCSQLAVPSGIPAAPAPGSFPCHRWALVSVGWRRSLLGILREAKATGSSGLTSSCFKNIPSPAGKWWPLPVGPEMKFPS